jgi:predicted dehydrogenase
MPTSVYAVCKEGKYHDISVEDDATLYCEYENGASGVFITSTGEYPGTNRLEIAGSRGKLVLENGKMQFFSTEMSEEEFRMTDGGAKNRITVTEYTDSDYDGHVNVLKAFASAVLYGNPLVATGREALNELTISNAAYLSSHKKVKIDLPFESAEFLSFLNEKRQDEPVKKKTANEVSESKYKDRWKTKW